MDNLPVIIIRFALYADLMVMAGMVAFSLYALTSTERSLGILSLRKPAIGLSLTGLGLSGFGMAALVAAMTGSSVWDLDGEVLREIISESAIGTAWIVRIAVMIIAVLAAGALDHYPKAARWALLVSSAVAIATLVWTGHAGATEGWTGTVHRLSDVIHMLAASVWLGGLVAFSWMLFRPQIALSEERLLVAHRALDRFSLVGTLAVGLIVATGIINWLAIVGLPNLAQATLTPYGKLLIIKLLLFVGMLALAGLNRWRLTPGLGIAIRNGDTASAIIGLRRSLLVEGGAALAILALVAWLGTLDPLGITG